MIARAGGVVVAATHPTALMLAAIAAKRTTCPRRLDPSLPMRTLFTPLTISVASRE
jgi:hypothetical protein